MFSYSASKPALTRPARSSFVATVNRMETVKKLRRTFQQLGGLGPTVQVRQASENVKSVAESDVVLLWSVAEFIPVDKNSLKC